MTAKFCVTAAILAAALLGSVLFLAIGVALAPFARVAVKRAVFGVGPRILAARIGPTPLEIRAIPTSSHLEIHGMLSDEQDVVLPPPLVLWFEASPLRRALVFVFTPRIALLVIAAAILGPTRACGAVARGCAEILAGAIAPLSTARTILEAGAGILGREGIIALAAVAICKWLSLGLITLPMDLPPALMRQHSRRLGIARFFAMLALFCVFIAWAVAWIAWITR